MFCKKCIHCEQTKPIGDFSQSEFTPDGYVDGCWTCRQRISRQTGIPVRSWAKENPSKHNNRSRLYSVKSRLGYGAICDETITIEALYARDGGICGICKKEVPQKGAHIDHIIPLSKGGDHIWDNIQLVHKSCNSKKNTKVGTKHD